MKFAVVVMAVVGLSACAATPKLTVAFSYDEVRGRLAGNGLRYVVMPDASTQLVEVDVRFEVGSREDPPGKAGLAHLAEHLMLELHGDGDGGSGAPSTPSIRQLTLQHNAYTNEDTTHFMFNARAEVAGTLLAQAAAAMELGCTTISKDSFVREREVVRNELRERRRVPEALIPQLAASAIYPPDHPYAHPIEGDDDAQLSTLTLRDACAFIAKYYVPERAIVVVAGGISADSTIRRIESEFRRVSRHRPTPRPAIEPRGAATEARTFELDTEHPWVSVAWSLPDARTAEGDLVLSGIRTAFLDRSADEVNLSCARRTFPQIRGGEELPIFLIALELDDASQADDCVARVWTVIRGLRQRFLDGWYDSTAARNNRRKVEFVSQLEPLFGIGGRTDRIADLVQFSLDVDFDSRELYAVHEFDRLGKLRGEDLELALSRTLDPSRARVTVFTTGKKLAGDRRSGASLVVRADDPDETAVIDPREAETPIALPTGIAMSSGATRFSLANGMRVVLLPRTAMPIVAMQLVFDGGELAAADNPLLATAAAHLLPGPDWTMRYSGADVRRRTSADRTAWTTRGLSVYFDVMVKEFDRVIRAGSYEADDVQHWKQRTEAWASSRRTRSARAFESQQRAALFGLDHPYTRSSELLPRGLSGVNVQTLSAFQARNYGAANATFIVTGAFDPRVAEAQIRDRFASWPAGVKIAPAPHVEPVRTGPRHVGVDGDDAAVVDLALVYPSPAGLAGEQAARLVLTQILDDLMWSVRTRLGAAYSPYAYREALLDVADYRLACTVDASRAGEVLREIRNELDALRRGDDLAVRFVRARRKVVDRLLGQSTVSTALAAQLADIARFGLEPTYYTTLVQRAAALSVADVQAVLEHELAPDAESVIAHGTRSAVTAAFADAGVADVTFVEPDHE